jgi:hypothetical protein
MAVGVGVEVMVEVAVGGVVVGGVEVEMEVGAGTAAEVVAGWVLQHGSGSSSPATYSCDHTQP